MWRPGRRPGGSPGRKGALRTSVVPGPIVSTLTGGGFGLLVHITRKLRIFGQPKRLRTKYPQSAPRAIGAGYGALPYVSRRLRIFFRPKHIRRDPITPRQLLYVDPHWRIKRVSWIVNTARFAILSPPQAALRKPLRTIRFKQKRPLWRFFRPRHGFGSVPPFPPVQTTGGAGVNSYALPYVSRRLRSYYRPRHVLPQPRPVTISWKRSLARRYRPRRLSRWFFKRKYIYGVFPPPVLPPQVTAGFGALPYVPRQLLIFGRPKRIYPIPPARLAFRPFRQPLRFKQKRPLWRFFRPRHVLGFVPLTASGFLAGGYALPYISRRLRIYYRPIQRKGLPFATTPRPPPPSAAEWLVRHRRRGRR